jgi:hypothetical protein
MHTIRREEDDEIMGHVVPVGGQWQPTTVFNAALADPTTRDEAEEIVLREGLACLAGRWLVEYEGQWREAHLQEVRPDSIRVLWSDPMMEQPPHGQWIDTRSHRVRRA